MNTVTKSHYPLCELHDEGQLLLAALPRRREQAVVLDTAQFLTDVMEKFPLNFEKFDLDMPVHEAEKAVNDGNHGVTVHGA